MRDCLHARLILCGNDFIRKWFYAGMILCGIDFDQIDLGEIALDQIVAKIIL